MLKLTGLIGLVVSCGIIGIIKAKDLKDRVSLLECYYKTALDINSKINYFRQPLPEVLAECKKNGDMRTFSLLESILVDLKEKKSDIALIWAENITEIYADTSVTEKDMDIMAYMGTFLGQTDIENHEKQLEYLKEQLEYQIKEAKEISLTKGPMYQKIGFFCGAIIALVIL